ncbi:hypothetical protein OSB04_022275 [Centaurea solstitialis]|uniref:NAC domain-containing protein n=1 Tax=Centaurea solstitialis TaxID=347529 RepID=A0AA38TE66_9ASTR|nr:hypothetical protein OSB04_022275 [Centaurea solstitialis]
MSSKEDNISMKVNGQSQVPPGFRFHPTEEELLHYYLRKKIAYEKIDLDVIREVDLNKLEPWDIQEKCNIGSTMQNDWYFFSHKDKKYPTGTRTNRATAAGFWKATGRDKVVYSSHKRIGMRKTLVFYKGRAPHGLKSDWIMHEYRLDDVNIIPTQHSSLPQIPLETTHRSSFSASVDPTGEHPESLNNDAVLDQLLAYMDSGRSSLCKQESPETFINPFEMNNDNNVFLHLPRLESPGRITTISPTFDPRDGRAGNDDEGIGNWVDLDRFVASQLNGQMESSKHFLCEPNNDEQDLSGFTMAVRPNEAAYNSEVDIWGLTKPSLLDPLCHLSV